VGQSCSRHRQFWPGGARTYAGRRGGGCQGHPATVTAVSMWGIHNDTLTTELVDEGFVSIGWDELGDITTVARSRDDLKRLLGAEYPDRAPRAIAAWAGILHRFVSEIAVGDVVVAPYKPDSTINIGVVTGEYRFDAAASTHRHRRSVEWRKLGVSRTVFTQPALYEIGAFLAVFGVRKYADEFAAVLASVDSPEAESTAVERVADTEASDTADEPRASRIARHTRDFVKERLLRNLTHREFEEFTADLLVAMGYQARVTPYSQDGGVDVLAHRDKLGVEPPLIKVQCKHHTGSVGAPEVHQLVGTQAPNELSLFVTLGSYTRDALGVERGRQGLRLLNGEDVVDLVLAHYADLAVRWRARFPLTSLLVVDDEADA
jgi:restriction system protein